MRARSLAPLERTPGLRDDCDSGCGALAALLLYTRSAAMLTFNSQIKTIENIETGVIQVSVSPRAKEISH